MTLPTSVDSMKAAAKELLTEAAYNYFAAGSFGESTVVENVDAWSRWFIRPRIGFDTSEIDLTTTVLGTEIAFPVMIAPCGFNRLAHADGEFAVTRACQTSGTIHVLSSAPGFHPQEIKDVAPEGPKWLQLYADPDTGITDERVGRAVDAGYKAVAITVDTPTLGIRYQGLGSQNFVTELFAAYEAPVVTMSHKLDWKELERITSNSPIPVVLKGVMHPEDAKRAPDHGVQGVIVSNHGGRQLDGAIPTAFALPGVVEAADGRMEVFVDGGVQTGIDVLRALALGARAVLIGRPYLWALAINGEQGVVDLLERFRQETLNAMALAGQTDTKNVDRSIVVSAARF